MPKSKKKNDKNKSIKVIDCIYMVICKKLSSCRKFGIFTLYNTNQCPLIHWYNHK